MESLSPSPCLLCGSWVKSRTRKASSVPKGRKAMQPFRPPGLLPLKSERGTAMTISAVTSNGKPSKNFLKLIQHRFLVISSVLAWCAPCLTASDRVKHARIFFLRVQGFCRIISTPGYAKSAQFLSAYNPDQQFSYAKDYHRIFADLSRNKRKKMGRVSGETCKLLSLVNRRLVRQPRLRDAHV